jgi:Cfr10I/Bse634I restriction endonuclease
MAIRKNDEFEAIYPTLNLDGLTFLDIVDRIEREVRQKYGSKVTQGSLNNCRGTWNELAFIMEAHRSILRATTDLYIVKMGNENSIKLWEIYDPASRERYEQLLAQLKQREQPIFVRCSTPDFVVIYRDIIANFSKSEILESQAPSVSIINELYKEIKNKCSPDRVKGFISLKASNRPDRRYQIVWEANITKLVGSYIHQPSQKLRYDVISEESNSSDKEVFCNPLMPTISLGNMNISNTERAIDSEVNITCGSQLDEYWKRYEEIIELDRAGKAVSPEAEFANDNLDL